MAALNNSLPAHSIEALADEEDAYIAGYNVPVWALIGYLQAAEGNVAQVAADYDLPEEAVAAAQNYYRQHRTQIDVRIAANAAPQNHVGIRVSNAA